MSVTGGDTVDLKVSATGSAYHVDDLRLGYYQGNGARKVATLTGPPSVAERHVPGAPTTEGHPLQARRPPHPHVLLTRS